MRLATMMLVLVGCHGTLEPKDPEDDSGVADVPADSGDSGDTGTPHDSAVDSADSSGDSGGGDTATSADWTGTAIFDDVGGLPMAVAAVGELTGDGRPDLVVVGSDPPYQVVPVPESGVVGVSTLVTARVGYREFDDAQLGDLDGDGVLDVLARTRMVDCSEDLGVTLCYYRYEAGIFLGAPVGDASAAQLIDALYGSDLGHGDVRIAGDIDGDGIADVLFAVDAPRDGNALYQVHPSSTGALSTTTLLGFGSNPEIYTERGLLDLGDVDGDGADDLWLAGSVFHGPLPPYVDVDYPDSALSLGDALVRAADVDGDGLTDIVATSAETVWVVPGAASGSLADVAVGRLDAPGAGEAWISCAQPDDTDGDGRADLLFGGTLGDGSPIVYAVPGPVVGSVDLASTGVVWTDAPETGLVAEAVLEGEGRVVIRRYAEPGGAAVLHILDVDW